MINTYQCFPTYLCRPDSFRRGFRRILLFWIVVAAVETYKEKDPPPALAVFRTDVDAAAARSEIDSIKTTQRRKNSGKRQQPVMAVPEFCKAITIG